MKLNWELVKEGHWICKLPDTIEYGIYESRTVHNIEYEIHDDKENFSLYKTKRNSEDSLIDKNLLGKYKMASRALEMVSRDYSNHLILHSVERYPDSFWVYKADGTFIAS